MSSLSKAVPIGLFYSYVDAYVR